MTMTLEQRAHEMARIDTGTLAWRNISFEQFFLQHLQEAVGSAVDAVYLERNQVVAALAKAFPSGIAKTPIEGWAPEWHNCVYIDLPTGQVSWHYHDREAHLFAALPAYAGRYDGHTTPEKYERLNALAPMALSTGPEAVQEDFTQAINFALATTDEGLTFLRLWNEGNWPAIEREFPEFHVPEHLKGASSSGPSQEAKGDERLAALELPDASGTASDQDDRPAFEKFTEEFGVYGEAERSIAWLTWKARAAPQPSPSVVDVAGEGDTVKVLVEALRFYGDISKYPAPFTGGMGALWEDCGERARAALAAAPGDTTKNAP